MCPCVLIDKLKNAFGKKKKNGKNSENAESSDDSSTSPNTEKNKARSADRGKGKSKERSKVKGVKSTAKSPMMNSSVGSVGSESTKEEIRKVGGTVELLGQVIHNKKNPKNFTQKVLQTERPDLVGPEAKLDEGEVQTLDNYLLKKGEMRNGIDITLGNVVDCESSLRVGEGEEVTVIMLHAYGRFSAVYLVHRQANSEQEKAGLSNAMALKTSRRMYASIRTEHEISILQRLFDSSRNEGKLKNVPLPTHITPMFFHGTAGGTPYLIMPMMDVNLEKLRQEIGQKFPWVDVFYIGQEALLGIRQCHEHLIVHRDIKPTNLLLSIQSNKNWWLCDFGDACTIGESKILSPPDALTLPYLSRAAHQMIEKPGKATIAMDIESWFYMFLDLFVVLPWKNTVEEAETLALKNAFWSGQTEFFEKHKDNLPPQMLPISQIVSDPQIPKPYAQLTLILRDGFNKNNKTPPWKPYWIEKRVVKPNIDPPIARTPEVGAKKKKEGGTPSSGTPGAAESKKAKKSTMSKAKSGSKSGSKSEAKSVIKTKSESKSASKSLVQK